MTISLIRNETCKSWPRTAWDNACIDCSKRVNPRRVPMNGGEGTRRYVSAVSRRSAAGLDPAAVLPDLQITRQVHH